MADLAQPIAVDSNNQVATSAAGNGDFVINTFGIRAVRPIDLVDGAAQLQATNAAYQNAKTQQAQSLATTFLQTSSTAGFATTRQAVGLGATVNNNITTAYNSLTPLQGAINGDLPMRVSNVIESMLVAYQRETDQFDLAKQAVLGQFDARINSNLNGLLDDLNDRYNLVIEDSTYIYALNANIAANISQLIVADQSQTTAEAAALASIAGTFSSLVTANVTFAINGEISRITAVQTAYASTVVFRLPAQTGTDYQACTPAQASLLYLSATNNAWFYCSQSCVSRYAIMMSRRLDVLAGNSNVSVLFSVCRIRVHRTGLCDGIHGTDRRAVRQLGLVLFRVRVFVSAPSTLSRAGPSTATTQTLGASSARSSPRR